MEKRSFVKRGIVVGLLAFLWVGPAVATPLVPLIDGEGDNSGWSVGISGATTGVSVVDVDLGASEVILTVEKDYQGHTVDGGDIEFPVGLLSFVHEDGQAVGRIIIRSETVANNTGITWTAFRWSIFETGVARFNISASSGWVTSPLTVRTWQDIDAGDNNLAGALLADGGVVPSGGIFSPGVDLVIDTDVGANGAGFTLKQQVIPEPGTSALLGLGALVLAARGRRRVAFK